MIITIDNDSSKLFLLGEQQDAVDNLITAMDLTDAQRWGDCVSLTVQPTLS